MKEKVQDFKRWLEVYLESASTFSIFALTLTACVLEALAIISFPEIGDSTAVLGTIVQTLASVFAIVFSVSLVAIQLCSEALSHRLISLYARDFSFAAPFAINLGALLFNWLILTTENIRDLTSYGIYWSIAAILTLLPFLIYTIRFLIPDHVVDILLYRIQPQEILSQDFSIEDNYQDALQPVEDIISNRVRNADYTTSRRLIRKVEQKMITVLTEANRQISTNSEPSSINRIMTYLSQPFGRLLEGIAICSNKSDAVEITELIVLSISAFVRKFQQTSFVPAYKVFDRTIDKIFNQAKYRYSSDEYKLDLARLEIAVADARVMFSQYVG